MMVGPGSLSLIWRKHGDPSADNNPVNMHSTDVLAVPGLGGNSTTWSVLMKPGYKYDLEFQCDMRTVTGTTTLQWQTYYRLRNKSTQAWDIWVPFDATNSAHHLYGTTTNSSLERWFGESLLSLTVSAEADAIEIGMQGDTDLNYYPQHAWARLVEYMP